MRFQCPACGFTGAVRVPAHLPKGKTVRIRCSRCEKSFPLSLGRLFPQERAAGYLALTSDSLSCRGTKVGDLWVETLGSGEDTAPLVALPAHPALPHDVMHDLLDTFGEYFRVCYLEFPGTRRNPQGLQDPSYGAVFDKHVDLLKNHLGVRRFHLLAHLSSAALALDAAVRHPDSVVSVVLLDPDLRLAEPASRRSTTGKLDKTKSEECLDGLLQDVWSSKLPKSHARGLEKILAPGFRPTNLDNSLIQRPAALHYTSLSRLKTPTLIIFSRDSGEAQRSDALYLQSTLTAAETGVVETGGPWAAWSHQSATANRLLAFKRRAESRDRTPPRRRSGTLNGQPLGWMILVFAVLAAGLSFGAGLFRFQPEFTARALPALLAGLLPILWFVFPKKMNPMVLLRFRRFPLSTVLISLGTGALLGVFYRSLLLTLETVALPSFLPESLTSLAPGSRGRLLELAGIAVVSLFVFGVAANLWVLRRSKLQVLFPALLFTLLPPAFPDLLWRLPLGFAGAVFFAADLSIYAPLFLIAGFTAASESPIPLYRLPVSWGSMQGVSVTIAVLAAAILLTVLLGTRGKPISPEDRYPAALLRRDERGLRWRASLGTVIIVFSLIAATALVFSFIAV